MNKGDVKARDSHRTKKAEEGDGETNDYSQKVVSVSSVMVIPS